MSAPQFLPRLGDRFLVKYHEGDEVDEYELEAMHVYEDGPNAGAIDVTRVTNLHLGESEWWSIMPQDWDKYWTFVRFTTTSTARFLVRQRYLAWLRERERSLTNKED